MSANAVPPAIPTAMAGRKPWMNSCRLTAALLPSSPEAVIAINVSTTSEGVEIRSERMISSPPTICQMIRNSATETDPTTVRAEGWRTSDAQVMPPPAGACAATLISDDGSRLRLLPGIRRHHLTLQQIPDALAIDREGRIVADVERARALKRDRNIGDDPPRRG